MYSTHSDLAAIRRADQQATMHAMDCRESALALLRQHLQHLLTHFDNHDIAVELQKLHNEQPEDKRGGYRMEIAMLSADYQQGTYDPSL